MLAGRPLILIAQSVPRRYSNKSHNRHAHSNQTRNTSSSDTIKGSSISRVVALTNDAIKHVQQSLQLLEVRRHLDGSDVDFVSLLIAKTHLGYCSPLEMFLANQSC